MGTTTDREARDLAWALKHIAQERDTQAWSMLVAQVGPDIQRLATRLIGDFALAEDAVQETFLLIRDHADRFEVRTQDADSDARRWILGVASHASFHLLRHHQRQKLRAYHFGQAVEQMKAPMADPASQSENADDAQLLRRELAELPDIYGQVLTLHYFADQDYPQLASHLRVSINTVRSRVNRGLKVLRERLDRCGVTLSIAALTGLLSNLGAAPVVVVALPSSALGIISSNAVATTTLATAGTSLVTAGTVIITAVLTTILAATVTVMGWSFDWFNAVTELPKPMVENRTPLPQTIPGADAKATAKPFIMVVKTDQVADQVPDQKKNERTFIQSAPLMPSEPNQFTLPLHMDYAYDFTINWGDGTTEVITKNFPEEVAKYNEILYKDAPDEFTELLNQELTLYFAVTTLEDAVAYLREMTKAIIAIDLKNVDPKATFSLNVRAMKFGEILKSIAILTKSDFTYVKNDHVILFTSRKNPEDSLSPTHTYAKAGTYTVEITENKTGGFPAIFFNCSGDCHKLMSITQWGDGTWKSMTGAFANCQNLTITAPDSEAALTGSVADFSLAWSNCSGLTSFPLLNTAAGTNFSYAWSNCSGLTSFPLLNTAAGTNFSYAWSNCSGLTSFPLLNTAAGTNFQDAWYYCSGLASFPLLNTAAGKNFGFAWSHCSGLTSFPLLDTSAGTEFLFTWDRCTRLISFPLLNTAAGTNFRGAWSECTGLTSFPLLNTAAGTDFVSAWLYCTGLTSFPLLNTAVGMNFQGAWANCTGLTSFPLLDTAAGTTFSYAWYNCTGLTSFPLLDTGAGTRFDSSWAGCKNLKFIQTLNFGNMTVGQNCFANTTLDSDSYSDLLMNTANLNLTQKITFDGGLSKMNEKALAARKILTTDRGWTIYDADAPKPIEKKNVKKGEEVAPRPKPQEVNDF